MGWGNSWGGLTDPIWGEPKELAKVEKDFLLHGQGFIQDGKHVPLDEVYATTEQLIKAYATVRNRKPTHDPYTNPNAHIYYECKCGAILDPQTKSFAALNNHASDSGWKIRFTDKGYVPYCVKCGEGVE